MQFHMTPGSCSTGIHVLLETLELPFEVHVVHLPAGEHRRPGYLALNPKGTIPTLVLPDGQALTDWLSIAWWLGRTHPRAGLLPEEPAAQARVLATVNHVVGTVHGQGYTRIFTPEAHLLEGDEAGPSAAARRERLQARGRALVSEGFDLLDRQLAAHADQGGWVCGAFSIADAALFYTEFWAERIGLAMPAGLAAHLARMKARPVVHQVLREEGYR
ncbi:glutathione S-transferase family protein [Sphaerotilus hippei]|nr:glutathione S-transferase [Sphaerotilus hippei]